MINLLTLFKEIISVYAENHKERQSTASVTGKADGTYSYLLALKG
jgi:hypothetical protein